MSVQELNQVHRRYIKISNGFKSAWTFHQFIQGLRKVFIEDGPASYPADFQSLYDELKQVSTNLSELTVELASQQLDEVESGLQPLIETLLQADDQVSPGLLRQFFQRVKNYDDNILSQLVKFYLYFRGDDWNWDRLDKADYLSTKVCEEHQDTNDTYIPRDRTHTRETAEGFWAALGAAAPTPESELAEATADLDALRQEIDAVASIDELHEKKIVRRYRDFKHRLGDIFFEPSILQSIIETNLVLKNHVQKLYHRDEQRIVAEYQQVFDLERETPPIDLELQEELAEFRKAVERYEQQLQGGDDVRLEHLATLRERVRDLLPRLQPETPEPEPEPLHPEVRSFLTEQEDLEEPPAAAPQLEDEHLEEEYQSVIAVLDDTNPAMELRKVVLQPEIFALGIDVREVVAYRRLFSQASSDQPREQAILRGAALRVRIKNDVDEIRGILDDTASARDAPAYVLARATLRHAASALSNYEPLIEQAVLDGESGEGRDLLRLKIKLMRAYSGLWLLIYKE